MTVELSISFNDGRKGWVQFENGKITAAESGNNSGCQAFYELAKPALGQLLLSKKAIKKPNIRKSNTTLLIEAMLHLNKTTDISSTTSPRHSDLDIPILSQMEETTHDKDIDLTQELNLRVGEINENNTDLEDWILTQFSSTSNTSK